MTPLSFEWQWNIDYLIFMGLLYFVLVVIGSGIIYTCLKTWVDLKDKPDGRHSKVSHRSKYANH